MLESGIRFTLNLERFHSSEMIKRLPCYGESSFVCGVVWVGNVVEEWILETTEFGEVYRGSGDFGGECPLWGCVCTTESISVSVETAVVHFEDDVGVGGGGGWVGGWVGWVGWLGGPDEEGDAFGEGCAGVNDGECEGVRWVGGGFE